MNKPNPEPSHSHYLRVLEQDAVAAAAALRMGGEVPVPTCPGWLVADVAIHLGAVHRQWTFLLQNPDTDFSTVRRELLQQTLPRGLDWFERSDRGPVGTGGIPSNLVAWFEEGAAHLVDTYRHADPRPLYLRGVEEPLEIPRLVLGLATETAVHRWDMQHAHACEAPLDRQLAEAGIPHMFEHIIPGHRAWAREHNDVPPPHGEGERYLFQQTDGDSRWVVHWEGDIPLFDSDGTDADAVVCGTASDLYLFLWQRLPAGSLTTKGKTDLLERYFELASL